MQENREANSFLSFLVFLLSLSTIFTIMFPIVVMTVEDGTKYQVLGFMMSLGISASTTEAAPLHYNFSFLALLPYLLLVLSTTFSIILYFKPIKLLYGLDFVLVLVTLVLFILSVPIFKASNQSETYLIGSHFRLGLGSILGVIFTSLSTIMTFFMALTTIFGSAPKKAMRRFE